MGLPKKVCQVNFYSDGFPRELVAVHIMFHLFLPVIIDWCSYYYILQNASIVSLDDDFVPDPFDNQTKHKSELAMEVPNLLSAKELLESVC